MKHISNWRLGTVFDIEANGLLDEATIFHVLSFQMADGRSGSIEGTDHVRFKKFLQYHIDNKIPVVGHYMVLFDVPLCEKLLDIDLSELMVIDTVALSWYLNTKRELHGLDSFHEDYGIAKPKIDNWDDLSYEEYKFRCEEDVKINVALWKDFMFRLEEIYTITKHCIDNGKVNPKRLSSNEVVYLDRYVGTSSVDEYINRILTFLMFKMDCARLQEKTRWKADVENIERVHKELSVIIEEAKEDLESIMPPIPKYGSRKKPVTPYKKDGTIKVATTKWNQAIENIGKADEYGNNLTNFTESENEVSVINKYEKPNANSPDQLKKLFYSHGWVPETFKYVKDPEAMELWVKGGFRKEDKPIPRKIPQINIDGDDGKELCPSILRLTESEPKILKYDKYTMVKHRLDTIKGFLRDLSEDGYLKARIGGFTNTLRIRHRELVNLVGVDKPYGEDLRGSLTCLDGEVLLGSDLSSLEDRTKHHFMLPHDPDYVATMMAEDYDPHILTAHSAGMVSDAELQGFKLKTLVGDIKEAVAKARKGGKTTNYACVPVENTEVLTKNGWKSYSELSEGDKILSYNTVTDILEEDELLKLHFFPKQPIISMGNKWWDIESTEDHRWFGWQRKATGHTRTNNLKRYKEYGFKTTGEVNSEFNIINSATYNNKDVNSITVEEATLIGWILSDGYYKWSKDTQKTSSSFGSKRCVIGMVAQAEHKYYKEVEDCLNSLGAIYRKDIDIGGVKTSPVFKYCISSPWLRVFLDRVVGCRKDKHEVDWVNWVLKLSDKAREGFLYSFWLADGDSKGKLFNKNMRITQNKGNICEAVELAMFFTGKKVTSNVKVGECLLLTQMSRGYTTAQEFNKKHVGNKDVFCLTTNNSTFIIRQKGNITITGNCVYGGSPEAIARGGGIDISLAKQLHEGYWKLNWSVKAIGEEQCVFEDSRKQKWLINPINGFCYSLRTEKDRFSTLAQGTGSFFFDIWVDNILTEMERVFKVKKLTGCFHDEYIVAFKDSPKARAMMEKITLDAIEKVNTTFLLRRNLGCDVQFGQKYSGIH